MLSFHLCPISLPRFFFVERHVRHLDPRWATSKHMQPALSLADRIRGDRSFSSRDKEMRWLPAKSILRWRADGTDFDASLLSWHCYSHVACTVNFAAGSAAVTLLCRQLWKPLRATRHCSLSLVLTAFVECATSCDSVCVPMSACIFCGQSGC